MIVPVITNGKVAYESVKNSLEVSDSLVKTAGFGDQLNKDGIEELLAKVKKISPVADSSSEEKNEFDLHGAILINEGFRNLNLDRADLRYRGFWEWISLKKQPDLVINRFSLESKERFLFGRRHCHFRLWLLADLLHEDTAADPYHFLRILFSSDFKDTQDFISQVLERSFSGYSNLVKALISVFSNSEFNKEFPAVPRKKSRELFMLIQHRQPVYCFAELSFPQAESYIKKEFIDLLQKD